MSSDDALYLYQVLRKYLKGLLSKHDLHTQIYKGHISVKSVGGVRGLVLCTSSDNALYLSQVLCKYLKQFQSHRLKQ